MAFEIFKVFPPDRDSPAAELNVRHDGIVDIPAEVSRSNGVLTLTIFQPEGGVAWTYPLDEWTEAVQHAVDALGAG